MLSQKLQPQPSEMSYEMVLTSQVHPAAEIPEPSSGIQARPCVNKHESITATHLIKDAVCFPAC